MACLLTPEPRRLIAVAVGLRKLPDEDRTRALKLFTLMTQFRMDRESLPQGVPDMGTDVTEIDCERNPVTRRSWQEGRHQEMVRSVLRLLSLLGPVDEDERTRIADMGSDDLERYEGELFEKVADRPPAEDWTPSP